MKRLLPLALFCLLSLASRPAFSRPEASEVLMFNDGAILIEGEADRIREIHEAWQGTSMKGNSYRDAMERIQARYGDSVSISGYIKLGGAELSGGLAPIVLPLRKAIVKGFLPPVEGLGLEDAQRLLSRLGFFAMDRKGYEEVHSDEEMISLLLTVGRDVAVLSGTSALDDVVIFRMGGRLREKGAAESGEEAADGPNPQ